MGKRHITTRPVQVRMQVQSWTMHSQDVTKEAGTYWLRRGGASVSLALGAALGP
jgi:hypothetical protein